MDDWSTVIVVIGIAGIIGLGLWAHHLISPLSEDTLSLNDEAYGKLFDEKIESKKYDKIIKYDNSIKVPKRRASRSKKLVLNTNDLEEVIIEIRERDKEV